MKVNLASLYVYNSLTMVPLIIYGNNPTCHVVEVALLFPLKISITKSGCADLDQFTTTKLWNIEGVYITS